jgi:LysR family transcriptional regulator, glycine cleavage system transcriptional activator
LNALRAFEAAARHESFAKAAQELGVTPAAIAQQVKSLEAWMRRPLFERLSQGLRLTPASRQALPLFGKAFDDLGAAVQGLRRAAMPEELRIAALPSVAQLWLQPRLTALRRQFPRLEISVAALERPPSFVREPYDLAVFYLAQDVLAREQSPQTELRPLAADALFPVCSPALLGKGKTRLPLASLPRFVLLHDGTWRDHWAAWLDFAGASGIDDRKGPSFSLYSLALEAALDGVGLLIGRRSLVQPFIDAKRLIAPFDAVMPAPTRLHLLRPRAARPDATLDAVADWLAKA